MASEQYTAGEREPLLGNTSVLEVNPTTTRKRFYRARPLWLVPFAITAALVRGMTMAPRVEVYIQLACASIHHHMQQNTPTATFNHTIVHPALSFYSTLDPLGPHLPPHLITLPQSKYLPIIIKSPDQEDQDEDPRKLPSQECMSDPAVQKEAVRVQTTLTTTMGLLSALTTGWWGHSSERYGRTRVLAMATLGLLLTDLTFILVATPGSALAAHGHKLLVIAPIIEGLLGGWSTLQSATLSYISDCTSAGSRATIFSRFNGVFFLGFSVGPLIGGWIIRNGIPGVDRIGTINKEGKSVTEVFWMAICLSFINFLLTTFLFPESLSKEKQFKAKLQYRRQGDSKGKLRSNTVEGAGAIIDGSESDEPTVPPVRPGLLSPLALFLPVVINETTPGGIRQRKDWSLTFLAIAMFLYMLSTGVFQIKYLYATHTYNWAADKLSYYISYLGGLRALALLFLFPTLISTFKPKPPTAQGKQAKPTKSRLATEINFDLLLTRCSLFVDIVSQLLIVAFPAPTVAHHMVQGGTAGNIPSTTGTGTWLHNPTTSTVLFVFASGLSSLGSGFIPACQSLALCIVQSRQLLQESSGSVQVNVDEAAGVEPLQAANAKPSTDAGIGMLFGALSTLQAVGQMILGPLLFGLLYGNTVADFPKAIFVVGGGILTTSLVCALMVRSPVERYLRKGSKGKKRAERVSEELEPERGRSRASKDLFGIAATEQLQRSNSSATYAADT